MGTWERQIARVERQLRNISVTSGEGLAQLEKERRPDHQHSPRWFRTGCRCGHRITNQERSEIVARELGNLRRAIELHLLVPAVRLLTRLVYPRRTR